MRRLRHLTGLSLASLALALLTLGACADTRTGGGTADNSGTNGTNGSTASNSGTSTEACETACTQLTRCSEFADACPAQVLLSLASTCTDACGDAAKASQIEAAAQLGCGTAVPATLDILELADACSGEDLCAEVTCEDGETCNPANGECVPGGGGLCDGVQCPAGQSCNPNNGQCEAGGGLCDGITCNAGETCNPSNGQCEDNGGDLCEGVTCDEGETCNPATGQCQGGVSDPCEDVNCPEGQACDPSTGQCLPDGPCADVECDPGEVCNPARGVCEAFDCVADAYEPNGEFADASDLPAEDRVYSDLSICQGDIDWYRLTIPAGSSALVDVLFSASSGDLDAYIVDAAGDNAVFVGESTDDNERLAIPRVDAETTFYIYVEGFEGATNAYSLQINLDPGDGGACITAEDCPEGFNCDTAALFCIEQGACRNDADCGSLFCDQDSGTCQTCITDDHCPSGVCETFECVACRTAADCIVDGASCVEGVCELRLCEDDPYEPNDSQPMAQPVGFETLQDAALCDGEDDWFRIQVPNSASLRITLLHEYAAGDIDIHLLDTQGQIRGSSQDFTDDEYIGLENLPGGEYFIRVFTNSDLQNDFQNAYTLSIELNPDDLCLNDGDCGNGQECTRGLFCAEQSCVRNPQCPEETPRCDANLQVCATCSGDSLEPNNSIETAHALTDLSPSARLNTCGDRDFYAFYADADQSIEVNIEHLYVNGDIDARLYGPEDRNRDIDAGFSSSDVERLFVEANEHDGETRTSGTYILEVYHHSGGYNTYNLEVIVQ